MTLKAELRTHYSLLRKAISETRRKEASETLQTLILGRPQIPILSYWPLRSELDLTGLNQVLAAQKRLFLPVVEKDQLIPYFVSHLAHLKITRSPLWEPDPAHCQAVDPKEIGLVLVPGLAFDPDHYRLGYGEGWYDRFLALHREIHSVGVGFGEQKAVAPLPRDPWDIPVKELLLT